MGIKLGPLDSKCNTLAIKWSPTWLHMGWSQCSVPPCKCWISRKECKLVWSRNTGMGSFFWLQPSSCAGDKPLGHLLIIITISWLFVTWAVNHGCYSHRCLKFPDFSLTNVKFPWPTELTISQISPDNGLHPPLTAILSTHLLMLSARHTQCTWIDSSLT